MTTLPVPTPEDFFDELKRHFGDRVIEYIAAASPYIAIEASALRVIATHLKQRGFHSLVCLSGLDTLGRKYSTKPVPPNSPAGTKPEPSREEIAVLYHLEAMELSARIALRVSLDRAAPVVETVSDIWKIANWHEREAYDMFGIVFRGHPELTRILCCDDWVGHPLRKDYEFPTQYRGVPHERRISGAAQLEKERADAR